MASVARGGVARSRQPGPAAPPLTPSYPASPCAECPRAGRNPARSAGFVQAPKTEEINEAEVSMSPQTTPPEGKEGGRPLAPHRTVPARGRKGAAGPPGSSAGSGSPAPSRPWPGKAAHPRPRLIAAPGAGPRRKNRQKKEEPSRLNRGSNPGPSD